MSYEDVIQIVGGFGSYQRRIYLLLCLPFLTCGLHSMAGVFLAAETDFRCLLPHESPENATYLQSSSNLMNVSNLYHYETKDTSHCEKYDVNVTDQSYDSNRNFSFTTTSAKCNSFVHDKTTYELTTTMECKIDFNVYTNTWVKYFLILLFIEILAIAQSLKLAFFVKWVTPVNVTSLITSTNMLDQILFLIKISLCDIRTYFIEDTIFPHFRPATFNLVCDKAWLRATADSIFIMGLMLGATIFGGLSDRYGRKPILCLALLLNVISGLVVAASPEIISYMILRFFVGAAVNAVYLINYVCAVEMVVPKSRLMVGIGMQLCFTLGYILTTGFAYFIRNWRILQIAITVPNIAFLVYWWFIPESARWLVITGRLEEAKNLLRKIALKNSVELSEDALDGMINNCNASESDLDKPSIFNHSKYPNLRRKSLLLFFNWFVNNAIYYGLSWNTASLVGNEYINFAISGLVEIPAIILVFFALSRWGRKIILCTSMLFTGISLLVTIFVPDDIPWLTVSLTMVGKLAVTASIVAVTVFTLEQFPTVIRNVGCGVCSACGMIGAMLSPYINYSSVIWKPLPVVIFGSSSLIAGLSTLLLPETWNEKLPESIEDGEQFGKKSVKSDNTSSNGTVFITKL